MKGLMLLTAGVVGMALCSAGCVNPTYTKTVTTRLDAKGNVVDTTVVEQIIEPHQGEIKKVVPPETIEVTRLAK